MILHIFCSLQKNNFKFNTLSINFIFSIGLELVFLILGLNTFS